MAKKQRSSVLNRLTGKKVVLTGKYHLGKAERRRLLEAYYFPHRRRVDAALAEAVAVATAAGDRVVHVASHSFTPELHGKVRTADIGMLYDPRRPGEVAFASAWIEALRAKDGGLRLRRNYPYLGASDGVCQVMRRRYPHEAYVGLELEVNQRYVEAGGPAWPRIRRTLLETLGKALDLPSR